MKISVVNFTDGENLQTRVDADPNAPSIFFSEDQYSVNELRQFLTWKQLETLHAQIGDALKQRPAPLPEPTAPAPYAAPETEYAKVKESDIPW